MSGLKISCEGLAPYADSNLFAIFREFLPKRCLDDWGGGQERLKDKQYYEMDGDDIILPMS